MADERESRAVDKMGDGLEDGLEYEAEYEPGSAEELASEEQYDRDGVLDWDEEEDPVSGKAPVHGAGRREPGGLRRVLSALGLLLLALIVVYLAVAIYLRVDSRLGADDTEPELAEEDPILYRQSELDEQLAVAEADAQVRVLEAYANGTADGQEEILRILESGLVAGDGLLPTIRPFYPDKVVFLGGGAYQFLPVQDQLRESEVSQENVVKLDSGEKQLLRDGEVVSHKGIDVSQYQGDIDWTRVAADGVEFAIMRAGYRGYGAEGRLVEDETFDANMQGAIAGGIHAGAYFFSQAITEEEVREEAQILLDKVAPYSGTGKIPLVIDVEIDTSKNYRSKVLTAAERTDLVLLFCGLLRDAGYQPYIYCNTEMGLLWLEPERLEEVPKWYAYYSDSIFYPYYYEIWQYTDSGRVDGISGNVDLNFSLTAFWE